MKVVPKNYIYIGLMVAVSLFSPALGDSLSVSSVTNLQHQGILVVPRPLQTDSTLINSIAQVGVKQVVTFPAGSNVARLIAEKCGAPSDTMLVHPSYAKAFYGLNPGADKELLEALEHEVTFTLPACAPFALKSGEYDNPKGLDALAKQLGVPFSAELFKKIVSDKNFKTEIGQKYQALSGAGFAGRQGLCPDTTVLSLFECINTMEILYLNRDNIVDEHTQKGRMKIPAVPMPSEARIPIDAEAYGLAKGSLVFDEGQSDKYRESNGIENVIPVAVPVGGDDLVHQILQFQLVVKNLIGQQTATLKKTSLPLPPTKPAVVNGEPVTVVSAPVEEDVKLVGAVPDVEQYGPDCADAAKLREGTWPFNPAEFMRVWALHKTNGLSLVPQNVLVMDTGLDFTYDDKVPAYPEADYFPRSYFASNTSDQADPTGGDRDGDLIPGNGGWSGVNLASLTRSGTTSTNDQNRSHGLSVATLVLGGRDLQQLRAISDLPVRIGIANLSSLIKPVLSRDNITNGFAYAVGGENHFNVVNLSLYTRGDLPGAEKIAQFSGQPVVIVAAAGNDGKELNDQFQAWPAELGGKPHATSLVQPVVITVGGHDGRGHWVKFSNYSSSKVDLLAPACMVPSFELRRSGTPPGYTEPLRAEKAFVSGTSFAAPVVSFLVALIRSDAAIRAPSSAKRRILVGTDFSFELRGKAFSAGILNVGKVLGYKFDILELGTRAAPKLRYGIVRNKQVLAGTKIICNDEEHPFSYLKKIAYDETADRTLLMLQSSTPMPSSFERFICPGHIADNFSFEFQDRETGETETISGRDVIDYIPSH